MYYQCCRDGEHLFIFWFDLVAHLGFLIMAFDTKTNAVVGTFRKMTSSNQLSQLLDCYGIYDVKCFIEKRIPLYFAS